MRCEMHDRQCAVRGFTLVEMMVAMVIGLVLMSAIYSILVASSDSYRRLQGLASIQERGRIAMNFLQNTIQVAGYSGCRSRMATSNILKNSSRYEYSFDQAIQGFDGDSTGWDPALPSGSPNPLPSALAAGGDVITVRGPVGNSVKLDEDMSDEDSVLSVPQESAFVKNDILMISDCAGSADFFQKTDGGGFGITSVAHAATGENSDGKLSRKYNDDATVVKMGGTSFFIRSTTGMRSLWWKEGIDNAQELIEGVDGMQVLYGVTTNSDTSANRYLTAGEVDDDDMWAQVVSVRIALLVATTTSVLRNQNTRVYSLLEVDYGPFNDLRSRRIFTTNITLRNRSF